MKIAVIGSGSWGTALAVLFGNKGYGVSMWARRGDLARAVSDERENKQYLPGTQLPESVGCTSSIDESLDGADVVVLAIPSAGLRESLEDVKRNYRDGMLIVHAGKGLESGTGLRGSEVIADEFGADVARSCVVLSGPNLAVELAHGVPTATVVASPDAAAVERAQDVCASGSLRVYRNSDLIGVELGGALKNVYAIGAGISDGLGFGDNTKATLVTRGLAEMMRLGSALGADARTFTGLSGIGDLMATCSSKLSRNLRLGLMLGEGVKRDVALDTLGQVAEGMYTCEAAYHLAQRVGVNTPIIDQIYAVLFEEKDPKQGVIDLMGRERKEELA